MSYFLNAEMVDDAIGFQSFHGFIAMSSESFTELGLFKLTRPAIERALAYMMQA